MTGYNTLLAAPGHPAVLHRSPIKRSVADPTHGRVSTKQNLPKTVGVWIVALSLGMSETPLVIYLHASQGLV